VFSELKNRGVEDVFIAVCDGLKGLPEAITTTWERTVVQQCIVHLIRNSFRYAGRQHRDGIVKALKPVYTAPSEQAAKERFAEFTAERGQRYPAAGVRVDNCGPPRFAALQLVGLGLLTCTATIRLTTRSASCSYWSPGGPTNSPAALNSHDLVSVTWA
jgi:hypothetical protein